MARASTLRRWSFAHTWCSLICTLFLLAVCVTGLPLIFSAEIDRLGEGGPLRTEAATSALADIDGLIATARRAFPTEIIRYIYWPDDRPVAVIALAPSEDADDALDHTVTFDAHTGLERTRATHRRGMSFMDVMRHLHEDLFLGLAGELFLGLMAILFLVAIVSGIVLYAPFMRHVKFGKHRAVRGTRLAWLDLHNVISAVALLWMSVLGITGVVNELATPMFAHWIATDIRNALPVRAVGPLPQQLVSLSAAIRDVEARLPGRKVQLVNFPTKRFASPDHFVVWTEGATSLTSRISSPAFVDAVTGQIALVAPLPWYLLALEISRPLHFGDYGGLPLKIMWAVFDVLTMIVLSSGVKLWFSRRRLLARRRANGEALAAQPTS